MKRNSQSGVALVITLVLLSVITFMAVTFLVVSRHEAAQVSTLTQQSNAKFAADAASEQAKGLIAAQMLAQKNGLNFGLLVSTNYINASFNPAVTGLSITNVSYNGITTMPQLEQMLANLLILPRPPVFITTNKALPNSPDFRYYLDLNRNGRFDTNGWVAQITNGNVINDANGNPITNFEVGDPEWIGILNHPEQPHSSSNLFVARYAYIALPIGNSLDFNYIHNQSQEVRTMGAGTLGQDLGYLRNQGVGAWEINLAGLLSALNNNLYAWPVTGSPSSDYYYYPANNNFNIGNVNQGTAFNDAAAIVQFRYNRNYGNVKTFPAMYGNAAANAFITSDGIDEYAVGPLMTNFSLLVNERDYGAVYKGDFAWSGADNPSQLFTTQDLFGNIPANSSGSFTNRLYTVGTKLDTYDEYTYYRMLAQISVGSAPEGAYPYTTSTSVNQNYSSAYANSPKMNLNYNNLGYYTNTLPGRTFVPLSSTNFVPWTALGFFTNAADRMLRAYFPNPVLITINGQVVTNTISITNIPIYPVNLYTPAIHRILQLAANMYDATTNKNTGIAPYDFDFPSVFQPYFTKSTYRLNGASMTNIAVAGYYEITNANFQSEVFNSPKDFRRPLDLVKFMTTPGTLVSNINIYGIPYVIGAKKGLPVFDKFSTTPMVQVSRKMQIAKMGSPTSAGWFTNIQYYIGVSNAFGVECWYPSTNAYFRRPVSIYITNELTYGVTMTNKGVGFTVGPALTYLIGANGYFPTNAPFTWYGSPNLALNPVNPLAASFKEPLNTNITMLPDSLVHLFPIGLTNAAYLPTPVFFETTGPGYFLPRFYLGITNRVRVIIQDWNTGRILDYVQLGGNDPSGSIDSTSDIMTDLSEVSSFGNLWSTNPVNRLNTNSMPIGIYDQYTLSTLGAPLANIPANIWASVTPPVPFNTLTAAQTNFTQALANPAIGTVAVPLSVISKYYKTFTWAVNDPLVHYTIGDLTDTTANTNLALQLPLSSTNILSGVFGTVKTNRYQPWRHTDTAGNHGVLSAVSGATELAYKDPLMYYSDNWQFPANKFPNPGWLGRVHRGTPWQSVYLKSMAVANNVWPEWTGDLLTNYLNWNYNGQNYTWNDAQYSIPTQDWLLMDLFTTALNDNATRGQLSVNQTNLAAWEAVLDGVVVATNTASGLGPMFIDPAQAYSGYQDKVDYILNGPLGINATRSNFPVGSFSTMGQLLSVSNLTVTSPYLDTTSANAAVLNDEAYEAIPQQIMSLVRLGTPRYVIFAYGQSLQPADHSIVQSGGPFFGICTNYQITGEVATRTVVRFDNAPIPGTAATTPHAVIESFNVLPPE